MQWPTRVMRSPGTRRSSNGSRPSFAGNGNGSHPSNGRIIPRRIDWKSCRSWASDEIVVHAWRQRYRGGPALPIIAIRVWLEPNEGPRAVPGGALGFAGVRIVVLVKEERRRRVLLRRRRFAIRGVLPGVGQITLVLRRRRHARWASAVNAKGNAAGVGILTPAAREVVLVFPQWDPTVAKSATSTLPSP